VEHTPKLRPKDNSLQGPEFPQPNIFRMGREYAKPCTTQCENEVMCLSSLYVVCQAQSLLLTGIVPHTVDSGSRALPENPDHP
jgi:hypothetical protein